MFKQRQKVLLLIDSTFIREIILYTKTITLVLIPNCSLSLEQILSGVINHVAKLLMAKWNQPLRNVGMLVATCQFLQ